MIIDEMIEVLQAYKEGKEIELFDVTANEWIVITNPLWNFKDCDYRVKKNPTRLEVANKLWKDTFGIDKRFGKDSCIAYDCEFCPIKGEPCQLKGCRDWWNEEYKGATE